MRAAVLVKKYVFQTTKSVTDQTKNTIQSVTGITNLTNLDKYLGCPIINGRVNKTIFNKIIENINSQLTKWKANSLSHASRSVLESRGKTKLLDAKFYASGLCT